MASDPEPAEKWPCPTCQQPGQVTSVKADGATVEVRLRCPTCHHEWIVRRASPEPEIFKPRVPE